MVHHIILKKYPKKILRLTMISLFFYITFPLFADENKNKNRKEKVSNFENGFTDIHDLEEGDRYGFFNNRRKGGPKFFSISPSALMQVSSNATIRSINGAAFMRSRDELPITGSLEASSNYFPVGDNWGFTFNARTYEFNYDRQEVQLLNPFSDISSDSGIPVQNLGSRIRGTYSHAFPAIYFGSKKENSVKLGVGVGPSEVNLSGTANFYPTTNPLIFRSGELNRSSFLNEVGNYQLLLGNDPTIDPIRSYLLANLEQGNNLERLGLYLIGKGEARLPVNDIVTLLQIDFISRSGNYSLAEIYSLLILNNGLYSKRLRSNATWTFFLEIPSDTFIFKLQITRPIYYSREESFNFSFIDISAQVPIEF